MEKIENNVNQSVNLLYKKYLESTLNIQYSDVFIKRNNESSDRGVWLCSSDGKELTEQMDNIIKLENGKYFLCEKWHDNVADNYFYDSDGNLINVIKNAKVSTFCEDFAKVTVFKENARCGYINIKGDFICEPKWGMNSGNFQCGRAKVAAVGDDNGKLGFYGFIDKTGELVIPCKLRSCSDFSDDVMSMTEGNLTDYYDLNGKHLFSEIYGCRDFSCGLVRHKVVDKYGFLDKTGESKIKAKYKYLGDFDNGIAPANGGYIDLNDKKVKVIKEAGGVPYIKGFTNNLYYNRYTGNYDKFNMTPFKDLDDYLLLINKGVLVLYDKKDASYTNTNISYDSNINLEVRRFKNFLCINGINFYLKRGGCVSLPSSIDISKIVSYEDSDILSFEDFETKISKDKFFYDVIMNYNKQNEEKRLLEELQNKKKEQDMKRQEIINQMQYLKSALENLDSTSGNLSKINEDLLFMKVEDHYEIKPEFINQLSFLDLHYIDFTNVKVSGINFAGTNALINPQKVYQKDMSNGIYDGLIFTSKNFSNVNVTGSSFKDCNMDFSLMENAIVDDSDVKGMKI